MQNQTMWQKITMINDADIRKWVDFIISNEMMKIGDVRHA